MNNIFEAWMAAKEAEREAVEERRMLEDELVRQLKIDDKEGSKTIKEDGFIIKVTNRYNRRIDADLLQDIAAEHGLSDHLGSLFRWKPDIDSRAWKAADESITNPLAQAITTTPGRPSFNIIKKEV
jgi:hypothetical protein